MEGKTGRAAHPKAGGQSWPSCTGAAQPACPRCQRSVLSISPEAQPRALLSSSGWHPGTSASTHPRGILGLLCSLYPRGIASDLPPPGAASGSTYSEELPLTLLSWLNRPWFHHSILGPDTDSSRLGETMAMSLGPHQCSSGSLLGEFRVPALEGPAAPLHP
jgi:hypothetical protein